MAEREKVQGKIIEGTDADFLSGVKGAIIAGRLHPEIAPLSVYYSGPNKEERGGEPPFVFIRRNKSAVLDNQEDEYQGEGHA